MTRGVERRLDAYRYRAAEELVEADTLADADEDPLAEVEATAEAEAEDLALIDADAEIEALAEAEDLALAEADAETELEALAEANGMGDQMQALALVPLTKTPTTQPVLFILYATD